VAAVVVFVLLPAAPAGRWYHAVAFALLAALGAVLWRARPGVDAAWWVLAGVVAALSVAGLVSELPATAVASGAQRALLAVRLRAGRRRRRPLHRDPDQPAGPRRHRRQPDPVLRARRGSCRELIAGPRLGGGASVANAGVVAFPFLQSLLVALAVRFMFWGTWRLVSAWLLLAAALGSAAANSASSWHRAVRAAAPHPPGSARSGCSASCAWCSRQPTRPEPS
jgi:hypothetical protein